MIGLGFCLLVLSIFDIKEKAVPWLFMAFGGILVGVWAVYGILVGDMSWYQPLVGVMPGVVLLVIARLTEKMGYADGIILMMIGAMVGYRGSILVLCLGSFVSAVFCVALLAIRKVKKHSRIAYIPFLTSAYLIYIFVFQ